MDLGTASPVYAHTNRVELHQLDGFVFRICLVSYHNFTRFLK